MPGTDREIQDNHSRDPQDADGYHHAPLKESADRHVAHGWKSGLVYPRPGKPDSSQKNSCLFRSSVCSPSRRANPIGPLPLKGHGTYEDQLIPREHAEFRSPRAGPTHVGSSILDPEEALELCRAGWAVAQVTHSSALYVHHCTTPLYYSPMQTHLSLSFFLSFLVSLPPSLPSLAFPSSFVETPPSSLSFTSLPFFSFTSLSSTTSCALSHRAAAGWRELSP